MVLIRCFSHFAIYSFLNLDKSVLTISVVDAEGDSLASRETSFNTLNEAKDKLQITIRAKFDQVILKVRK